MSKCRYDLSENCNNTDCHNCMLNKIKAEIYAKSSVIYVPTDYDPHPRKVKIVRLDDAYKIIDNYREGYAE